MNRLTLLLAAAALGCSKSDDASDASTLKAAARPDCSKPSVDCSYVTSHDWQIGMNTKALWACV